MWRKIAYSIAIALILMTPFIYSDELYNGVISAKQIWFYAAMALLMLVTAIDLLFDRRPFALQFNKIDVALLVFYAYYLIRAATTPYMPMLHNQRFINWTLCIILYFTIKRIAKIRLLSCHSWSLDHLLFKKSTNNVQQMTSNDERSSNDAQQLILFSFIINFLILTGLGQAIWGLLQLYDFLPSFNSNFKVTGTFFNPAPYALYLAVIFPIALSRVLFNDNMGIFIQKISNTIFFKFLEDIIFKLPYYVSLAAVTAILLVLPATMIRAAWLGALAGALVVLQYKYHYIQRIRQFLNTRVKKMMAMAVALTAVAVFAVGIYHIKKDSANGKLFIWEVTLGKIIEKPLFGYGVGRFETEYNNWQSEYFQKHQQEIDGVKGNVAGNTKYAFNEYLEITSEVGLMGLFLFLSTIVLLLLEADRFCRKKLSITQFTSFLLSNNAIFSISSLICLFVTLVISFPLYSLPTLMLFIILLAIVANCVSQDGFSVKINNKVVFYISFIIIGSAFLLCFYAEEKYVAYYTWDEADKLYKAKSYTESCRSFAKNYNQLKNNGLFLQYYGKALYTIKDYQNSANQLETAINLTSDEFLYNTLGDDYKMLNSYRKAEKAYQFAINMVPHKHYSLYLLIKLYNESNEEKKMIQTAQILLNKKVKIQSKAIDQMNAEVTTLVNNYRKLDQSNSKQ